MKNEITFLLFLLIIITSHTQCSISKLENKKLVKHALFQAHDQTSKIFSIHSSYFSRTGDLFISNSKLTGIPGKSYRMNYKFQINERCQNFIKNDSLKYNVTRVAVKSYYVNGNEYKMYKYYYDEHASWDEEEVIIVHEDIGILFIHYYWGDRIEITEHPKINKEALNKLKNMIKADNDFYKTWDSCMWN